jgi:GWxTD domain-containing protein
MRTASDFRPFFSVILFAGIGVVALAQSTGKQPVPVSKSYLSHHLPAAYQNWLDEDVRWIISDDERNAFEKLTDQSERDRFIEQFWLRRDPTPGTAKNQFKEEHYRRIAYSNVHFASQVKGSLTDRGRIYILYGPPDAVQSHKTNGVSEEIWHYDAFSTPGRFVGYEGKLLRYRPATGSKVDLEFFDNCQCNDYRLNTAEPR